MKHFFRICILGFLLSIASKAYSQDIRTIQDSLPFKAIQNAFYDSINSFKKKNPGESADMALLYGIYTELTPLSRKYRYAEMLARRNYPEVSMRHLNHLLDSVLISGSFSKCYTMWGIIIHDYAGYCKYIDNARLKPARIDITPSLMAKANYKFLVWHLQNRSLDSIITLFDRKSNFDSIKPHLKQMLSLLNGKKFNYSVSDGAAIRSDSSQVKVMYITDSGNKPVAVYRIRYSYKDIYGKIEAMESVELKKEKSDKWDPDDGPPPPPPPPPPNHK